MRRFRSVVRLARCVAAGLSSVTRVNAGAQALSARLAPSMPGIDSLTAAEFAKDSIGSITVGVIAGADLIWTRSYGFADMKTKRLANRQTVYRIGGAVAGYTASMYYNRPAQVGVVAFRNVVGGKRTPTA